MTRRGPASRWFPRTGWRGGFRKESHVVRGVQGNGKPFEMRVNLRTIIWHMAEEELHHRGEMNALFW